jgi:hypothetical protein
MAKGPALDQAFRPIDWRVGLFLMRRLVFVGFATLLVLLTRLLSLLGVHAALGGIRGVIRIRCSKIDVGHAIFFRISARK